MARWDVFDIIMYGTSLTDIRNDRAVTLEVAQGLQRISPNREIRMYQLGKAGAVASTGLLDIGYGIGLRPKCAILEYGMNDASVTNEISLSAFVSNMGAFIDQLKAPNPNLLVALMTMNPAIAPSAVSVPNLLSYYQAVRDLAAARNALLIDITPIWGTPTSEQIPDGIHPTKAANMAITLPTMISRLQTIIPA